MSAVSKPGWNAGSFCDSAVSAVRCPPAEPPVTQMKPGSAPYSCACSRIQRIARFTSTMCAGNFGLRREAVVDREAHPAAAREISHQRPALLALVADHPAAAVDLDAGSGARCRARRAARCRAGCARPCRRAATRRRARAGSASRPRASSGTGAGSRACAGCRRARSRGRPRARGRRSRACAPCERK